MKLKNIESIEELKVGEKIYTKAAPHVEHEVLAKCDGAIMFHVFATDQLITLTKPHAARQHSAGIT